MIKKLEHQTKMEFGTGDIGFNAGAIKEDDDKVGIVIFYYKVRKAHSFRCGMDSTILILL